MFQPLTEKSFIIYNLMLLARRDTQGHECFAPKYAGEVERMECESGGLSNYSQEAPMIHDPLESTNPVWRVIDWLIDLPVMVGIRCRRLLDRVADYLFGGR